MVPDECEKALIRFCVSGTESDFVDFDVNARKSIEGYCHFLLPQGCLDEQGLLKKLRQMYCCVFTSRGHVVSGRRGGVGYAHG